jgi:hypothetical protein
LWLLKFPCSVGNSEYSKNTSFFVISNPSFVMDFMVFVEREEQEVNDIKAMQQRGLTYGAEPFLRSCQLCSHSENSQQF